MNLQNDIKELCQTRKTLQELNLQKEANERRDCMIKINLLESNIDHHISEYLNEWSKHSQWLCNQAAKTFIDKIGQCCQLESQLYIGDIGCCFTNSHQDLVQIECIPSFDLNPKVFTFELDTQNFICQKRFLNVMKAKLLLHQICKYVHQIAVSETSDDKSMDQLYQQIVNARKLLKKINQK